ncbi:MAG: phage portal protein [Kiloniellales bacterium]|nr:phage portal protein [Kiloniellales bacterium]
MTNVNWLDRVIASVVPGYAMRRLAARVAMQELAGLGERRYEAARRGRRTEGWMAPGTSANAEIGPQLATLRNRSRELGRNNPMAARIFSIVPAKMVGTGITPRAEGLGSRVKQRSRDEWQRFSDNCDPQGLQDWPGIQQSAARTVMESGAALLRFLPRPNVGPAETPLQVRVLEPDYIDLGRTQRLNDGGAIIQGVEFDAEGRRRAYWLFDEHPGDSFGLNLAGGLGGADRGFGGFVSRRVDAEFVRAVFDIRRPGQVHGVPWLAPAAVKMRDVDDLEEARLVKKKIESCFVAFVHKSDPSSPLAAGTTTDSKQRRIEKVSPGMINYLGPDEQVTFGEPKSSEGDTEWLIMQMHAIAAAAGATYSMATGDLRRANYSNTRAGNLDFWALLDGWQHLMLIPQLCRPTWAMLDRLLLGLGRRQASIPGAVWDVPERPLVDPDKDGRALDSAVRSGRRTLKEVIAARGRDPEAHLEEIADTNALIDALELVLDSDPRLTSSQGGRVGKPGEHAGGDDSEVEQDEDENDGESEDEEAGA